LIRRNNVVFSESARLAHNIHPNKEAAFPAVEWLSRGMDRHRPEARRVPSRP
jgi:hypothetical protein